MDSFFGAVGKLILCHSNARSSLCYWGARESVCKVVSRLTKAPQRGAAVAEIKVPSLENTELEGSPFQPGVGQYIAIHATLNARDFILASFSPSGPFICIFSKTSPEFFMC